MARASLTAGELEFFKNKKIQESNKENAVKHLEEFATSQHENLKEAKAAFEKKDWKSYYQAMKPIVQKAEKFVKACGEAF